jgi:hypothetical protein
MGLIGIVWSVLFVVVIQYKILIKPSEVHFEEFALLF